MYLQNQGVVHLHLSHPYLISMLQKSQIKKLYFIEHHSTCACAMLSEEMVVLITQSV